MGDYSDEGFIEYGYVDGAEIITIPGPGYEGAFIKLHNGRYDPWDASKVRVRYVRRTGWRPAKRGEM